MKKFLFLALAVIASFVLHAQTANPEDTLKQYTGKYKFPDGSPFPEVNITLDNGVLTASSASGSSELRLTGGDEFEIVAYGGTATFKRSPENKIISVHVVVDDIDIVGTKTEGLSFSYLVATENKYQPFLFNLR